MNISKIAEQFKPIVMKSFIRKSAVKEVSFYAQAEILTVEEMYKLRGGLASEKIKTKEIDIYDTRED